MEKIKIFVKEIGNVVTNILVPLLSVICAVLELCHAPAKWIAGVKVAEYFCFYASGTVGDIGDLKINNDDKTKNDDDNDTTGGNSGND